MEYLTVEEARSLSGLRLVLTRGVPGPWGEAAKALFKLRAVDYVPVQQKAGDENTELVQWTKHRNAPIALYENEAPRVRWLELLDLAERLGSGPSLVPENRDEKMFMVGLINEIAGEGGLGWNARMLMFHAGALRQGPDAEKNPMYAEYQYSLEAIEASKQKIEDFLQYLSAHIKAQEQNKTHFLVGSQFTAADVYWAYFSNMLQTLPPEVCAVSDGLRGVWGVMAKSISGYDPVLIEQRDTIFQDHLVLPLEF
ncbi:MAG: glutathione S-transferase domain-containing protein [Halioglobus sp.]